MSMNQGWICPKCETCFSPKIEVCFYCKHVKKEPNLENVIRRKYGDINTPDNFDNSPLIKECNHEWYPDLLLSYPPKIMCNLCGLIKPYAHYATSELGKTEINQ